MPAKLERCVARVKRQGAKIGRKKANPWAVCVASTGLKPHKKRK
jgi:hypothetical protein